jgi:hypothetical protein
LHAFEEARDGDRRALAAAFADEPALGANRRAGGRRRDMGDVDGAAGAAFS